MAKLERRDEAAFLRFGYGKKKRECVKREREREREDEGNNW